MENSVAPQTQIPQKDLIEQDRTFRLAFFRPSN